MVLTPLAISALALLAERPMHPYEMYQLMRDRSEDRLVKVRPGSLYHSVERLHDHRLVEVLGTERAGNRPERTTYAITSAGRDALTARIRELISEPVDEYPYFPLALSQAHHLPQAEAVACLGRYVAALDEQIAEIVGLVEAAEAWEIPPAYWLQLDYLRTTAIAQRDWIAHLIVRIENEDFAWQPHLA